MIIGGFVKNSFVDYRGKIASVVFLNNCNMNCYYCHNRHLLKDNGTVIEQREITDFLKKRIGLVEAVVISGGEPLMNKDLINFMHEIKKLGYLLKLDTNGSYPDHLEKLINTGFIDYIAMDIKAPFHKYKDITGMDIKTDKLKKSIELIKSSSAQAEFRTTLIPVLDLVDVEIMSEIIEGANYYVLQQYKKPDEKTILNDIRNSMKPHSRDFFDNARKIALKYVKSVDIRGI